MKPSDPHGAWEGRKGGVLEAFDADNGKKLAECKLPAPPVWNGMAAANGRFYLSMKNGKIICLAGEHYENTEMYPNFAEVADKEGFAEIATVFRKIAVAEKRHEQRYLSFVKNINEGFVFKRDGVIAAYLEVFCNETSQIQNIFCWCN